MKEEKQKKYIIFYVIRQYAIHENDDLIFFNITKIILHKMVFIITLNIINLYLKYTIP